MSKRYVLNSFIWGTASKLFDAVVKFISVPLLLSYFGKSDFGLITLATSINAYLQLLDMGINTGAVKFFSEWIAQDKITLIDSTARTSITFYGFVGIINALLLIAFAFTGLSVFSLDSFHTEVLQQLFFILSGFAVVNWSTSVFNQLLTANHDIQFIQKVNFFKTFGTLLIIYLTMNFQLQLTSYFILFCIVNSLVVIPLYIKCKMSGLISSFKPGRDWCGFKIILKYSLAVIAMGIFQMSATKLRPIILAVFSSNSVDSVAEFRIIETITLFIISIGGMFISILLPTTSRLMLEKNQEGIQNFAIRNTFLITIICSLLCMPFLISAEEIIEVYVGKEYLELAIWMRIWVLTILFFLHNSPVASLVLSSGKTRMLVLSSAISCFVSLTVNAFYAPSLGVGSAIIGYTIYIVVQMSFYYLYFNSKVLALDSAKIFKSFIIPGSIGILSAILVYFLPLKFTNLYFQVFSKTAIWIVFYFGLLFTTRVITVRELLTLVKK